MDRRTTLEQYVKSCKIFTNIFRAKNLYRIGDNYIKQNAYAFDFAPNGALRMASYAAQINIKPESVGGGDDGKRKALEEFLNYCSIIIDQDAGFEQATTETLMSALKKVYILKVFNSGFEDNALYNGMNGTKLQRLSPRDIEAFEDLRVSVGVQQSKLVNKVISVNIVSVG
jgi:hypothetical protein